MSKKELRLTKSDKKGIEKSDDRVRTLCDVLSTKVNSVVSEDRRAAVKDWLSANARAILDEAMKSPSGASTVTIPVELLAAE